LTDSGTAVIGGKAVPERLNVIDEGTVADGGRRAVIGQGDSGAVDVANGGAVKR